MKHIGIVAISAEGAALCYRTIAFEGAATLGKHRHPEVTMHTFPLARYMAHIEADDWAAVADLILESAKRLAGAGADFLICPDNTAHQAIDLIIAQKRSPLPWIHIATEVASAAAERGFRRIAVLGTKYLMESAVYPAKLDAAAIGYDIPDIEDRERINRVIFDDLVYGRFEPRARNFFRDVIDRMRVRGCDAVALACTEIPLLIGDDDSPLPTLDSTRILARAALREAVKP